MSSNLSIRTKTCQIVDEQACALKMGHLTSSQYPIILGAVIFLGVPARMKAIAHLRWLTHVHPVRARLEVVTRHSHLIFVTADGFLNMPRFLLPFRNQNCFSINHLKY